MESLRCTFSANVENTCVRTWVLVLWQATLSADAAGRIQGDDIPTRARSRSSTGALDVQELR